MEHIGAKFEGGEVRLDGNSYRGCTFENVVFHYEGGPVTMVNCTINGAVWNLQGDLARGLTVMRNLLGPDGFLDLLRETFANKARTN